MMNNYQRIIYLGGGITGFFVVGRLVTELSQHLGQISYIRGMIRGLNK